MLRFFKPTSTTGGGKGSRDVMDSSGGASSDVEVLSTGVAGGREGGTGAGSDAWGDTSCCSTWGDTSFRIR